MDFDMELHTVLVRRIKSVLESDENYPYLSLRCAERLAEIRQIARASGITRNLVTPLSDKKFAVFPWVGTRQLFTLHYALAHRKIKNRLPFIIAVYLEVVFDGTAAELEDIILDIASSDLNLYDLPLPDKAQVRGKYNEFIPPHLLRRQFVEDFLDFEGLRESLLSDYGHGQSTR